MKKVILVLISIFMVSGLLCGCDNENGGQGIEYHKELSYEDIANEIVRFHVIANSDSDEDQNLKLKVRDNVIRYVSNELQGVNSIEDARKTIIDNSEEIEDIAREVIKDNGYNYEVKTTLSRENFPDKYYGELLFPQGEYEAFRILIGDAVGQNWWCVMFPPLCFVDETTGAINTESTKENFKNASKDNIDKKKERKASNDNKNIQFKFKLLDMLKKD